jgi:hypothetical protein
MKRLGRSLAEAVQVSPIKPEQKMLNPQPELAAAKFKE